jgi:hypothetical protein
LLEFVEADTGEEEENDKNKTNETGNCENQSHHDDDLLHFGGGVWKCLMIA